jgi:hypothetical protein
MQQQYSSSIVKRVKPQTGHCQQYSSSIVKQVKYVKQAGRRPLSIRQRTSACVSTAYVSIVKRVK